MIEDFLARALPSKQLVILTGPFMLIYVLLVAILVCYLKKFRQVPTP